MVTMFGQGFDSPRLHKKPKSEKGGSSSEPPFFFYQFQTRRQKKKIQQNLCLINQSIFLKKVS